MLKTEKVIEHLKHLSEIIPHYDNSILIYNYANKKYDIITDVAFSPVKDSIIITVRPFNDKEVSDVDKMHG